MGNLTYKPKGGACTTLEERPEFAKLPNEHSRHYLKQKAEFALKAPRRSIRMINGEPVNVSLNQVAMTALIRAEEKTLNYLWGYKSEVSFDMQARPPVPFLSTTDVGDGANRRHSLNPFPPGYKVGLLRRPDVIIVTNPAIRWAGLAGVDHDGKPHASNLTRVVEVKFPNDSFSKQQERAYDLIAGSRDRFSVLDVNDCEEDGEREKDKSPVNKPNPFTVPHGPPVILPLPLPPGGGANPQPAPAPGQPQPRPRPTRPSQPLPDNGARRLPAPVYSPTPQPDPAWYERLGQEAYETFDRISRSLSRLSAEARAQWEQLMPWLREKGRWLRDRTSDALVWLNDKGEEVVRWSKAQLQAGLQALRQATDATWEQIKQIRWGEVLLTVGAVVVCAVLIVGAVVVCVLAAKALAAVAAALLALAGGLFVVAELAAA